MTGEPQGLATFPGVDQVAAWSVALRHGISPSVFTLTTAPQDDFIAQIGDFEIEFGAVAFGFSDCKIERADYRQSSAGMVWMLTILDRRWMWQGFGQIAGAYNSRNGDNSLRSDAILQSLAQLVSLCLDALDEDGYDVGDVPDVGNPTVVWEGEPPADALAALCDQFGLRVVLRTDDTVKICVVGQGASLAIDETVMENSLAITSPRPIASAAIVCAPNRYQVDLPLEPVAADVDGSLGPIDDMSYAPDDGWQTVDLVDFRAVETASRPLARRWVFRAYRVAAPFAVAEFGQVEALDQITPLESVQVTLETDDAGDTSSAPAVVFGQFCTDVETAANNVASPPTDFGQLPSAAFYRRPFVLDCQRGIVWFREQVYRNQNSAAPLEPVAATLYLRAAVSIRDAETGAWTRYTRGQNGGDSDSLALHEPHDEIVYAVTPRYNGQIPSGSVNNADSVNAQCDALLAGLANVLGQNSPRTVRYAGILPIELDGSIQQVVWRGGPGGATTTASYNQESQRLGPNFSQRRASERQRGLTRRAERERPAVLLRQLQNRNIA